MVDGDIVNIWMSQYPLPMPSGSDINSILNLMRIDDESIRIMSLKKVLATVIDVGITMQMIDDSIDCASWRLNEITIHRVMLDDGSIVFANSNNMEKITC